MSRKDEIRNLSKKFKLHEIDTIRLNSEAEIMDLRITYSIFKATKEHLNLYDSLVKYAALKRFTRNMSANEFLLLEKRIKKVNPFSSKRTDITKLSLELFLISDYCQDICKHKNHKSCFDYGVWKGEGVSLHFTNVVIPKNPLKEEEFEKRQNELRRIAKNIKGNHPEIKYIFSVSWMWNLKVFQDLMPEEFNKSLKEFTENRLYSMGHWGQFYRYDGTLDSNRIREFKHNWKFPLNTLVGKCDIKYFFRKYLD